jgi:hypothetical protein
MTFLSAARAPPGVGVGVVLVFFYVCALVVLVSGGSQSFVSCISLYAVCYVRNCGRRIFKTVYHCEIICVLLMK